MDNTQYDQMNIELKKEIMHLLRHPETAWYGGVILLGKIELDDAVRTAYTDGFNVRIGTEMFARLTRGQRRLLIMHEMFHKAFMHLPYYKSYWKEDAKTANLACDHVVNNLCMSFNDRELCEPIPNMVWDVKYRGWSVPEIYRDLKQDEDEPEGEDGEDEEKNNPDGGNGECTPGENGDEPDGESSVDDGCLDEHDWDAQGDEGEDEGEDGEGSGKGNGKPSPSELERKVKEALQQGGILAGRLGVPVPREFHEVMEPKVDWREVLREFITAHTVGRDEGTWRKYNRRMLPLDYLYPSAIKETPTELIVAIDLLSLIHI